MASERYTRWGRTCPYCHARAANACKQGCKHWRDRMWQPCWENEGTLREKYDRLYRELPVEQRFTLGKMIRRAA